MTTLFVSPLQWEQARVEIVGAEFHHLFRVSRLSAGARVRVADGNGRARAGLVEEVSRRAAQIVLGDEVSANEPETAVELVAAAPKKPRAEWMIEKTTELGVHAIRFLRTERAPREFGSATFDRFRRVALAAAQQCERSRVPEITGMHEFGDLESLLERTAGGLVFDPSGPPLSPVSGPSPVAVLIGPEGGWSGPELETFAHLGLPTACLGSRRLRVETAAVVGVAACLLSH